MQSANVLVIFEDRLETAIRIYQAKVLDCSGYFPNFDDLRMLESCHSHFVEFGITPIQPGIADYIRHFPHVWRQYLIFDSTIDTGIPHVLDSKLYCFGHYGETSNADFSRDANPR